MDDVAAYYASPPHPPHQHPRPHDPPSSSYYSLSLSRNLPPPVQLLPPPYSHPSPRDEVRTLFIAGLPPDAKPREIYHLFREFPGYLSSHLRSPSKNSQPFAFAEFTDQQSAVAAKQALNGLVFDLEKGSTLYIDLAKSNSRSKRQRADDEFPDPDKKRKRGGHIEPGVRSFHVTGMSNSAYSITGYPPAQSHLSFGTRGISEGNVTQLSESVARHFGDNPPCPTIFVANLGSRCSEQELREVFSRCRGFLKVKIQSRNRSSVAFVDFQDTACSTEALSLLQGAILDSSPAGEGVRLEYAKSRMGKQRKSK